MKIKVTKTAQEDLDSLDPPLRSRVITQLRDGLQTAISTDPTLTLTDGTEARIHTLQSTDPVVLYRMFDVDDDGEDEAVILTIISRAVVSKLTERAPFAKSVLDDTSNADVVPSSIRVARDLISKIRSAEGQ